jgi:ABC-2 type transport system permease protein
VPIFDQGYQHWSGELSGHAWRWLTIARHGVRVGMKDLWVRRVLTLSWLPALGLVFVLCLWGLLERKSDLVVALLEPLQRLLGTQVVADPRHYRIEIWTLCYSYFVSAELTFSMILIVLVGRNLISQDLRFNALPLYFSRPLRRIDYFFGKLGVIGALLGMIMVVPALIAYILGMLFSLDITIVSDTFPILLAGIAYGAVVVLSAGTLILALSSLSRNTRYIALLWMAIWFVSGLVATALQSVERHERFQEIRSEPMDPSLAQGQFDRRQVWEEVAKEERAASATDWRPMISYTGNLSRIGRQLLGTDDRLESLSQNLPPRERFAFLQFFSGPQYPWYWSAGVLAVLFGLSVCILHFRVRSLDRLK